MTKPRYRAPADDFGILAHPAMNLWPELAQRNCDLLEQPLVTLGGEPLHELRRRARADFLSTSVTWTGERKEFSTNDYLEKMWVMTGHQPELYHPGVWAKNFAVSAVARKMGGVGVNLVADTDQLKANSLKVPSGDPARLTIEKLPFDDVTDGRPFEAWNIHNNQLFNDFGDNLRQRLAPFSTDPLINNFWPLAQSAEGDHGARKFSHARQLIEKKWGFGLVESPMSLWAPTASVAHIFCTILADLPRFHSIHDSHLKAYRKAHGIHSRNHPVADLQTGEGWWESPLWVWRDTNPLRKGLWVQICPAGTGIRLKMEGDSEPLGCLAIRSGFPTDEGIRQLQRLEANGIRIRPRALVTTALCRLLLADLFVHGIGGAIYDELGDSIFSEFFGLVMPEYAVCSATLRLTDFPAPVSGERLNEQYRELRRIRWKAETLADHPQEVSELIKKKREILSWPTLERIIRRRRAVELRKVNRQIADHYRIQEKEILERIDCFSSLDDLEKMAQSREYSFVVHSAERLLSLAEKINALA